MAETHDEVLQVLKEKMRLEGQLEALSQEASQVMVLGGRALCLVPPGLGSRVSRLRTSHSRHASPLTTRLSA